MSTSVVRSPAQAGAHVAQRAARLSAELQAGPTKAVNAAALTVKESVAGFLGGNSILLSGVGKKGAKIGVRYDIKGARNPSALVRATGPFQLIERDTKAHEIPKARKRRKSTTRRLHIGDRWVTGPVQHPGTQGKHPFEKGVNAARPKVERIYKSMVRESVRKSFGSPL